MDENDVSVDVARERAQLIQREALDAPELWSPKVSPRPDRLQNFRCTKRSKK